MKEPRLKNNGYVYILTSPRTGCIKIGGTDYPPLKRIKEINSTEPYRSIGPWGLSDFRQVSDWRGVESFLHYSFRSKLNKKVQKQKELFFVSSHEASMKLSEIDEALITKKPIIDRMFQDDDFVKYLIDLFKFTGIMNWLNIQGAWTFVLFPSTSGGRYYTLNIGPHEVAFTTLPRKYESSINMILVDKLIFDFKNVVDWVKKHGGKVVEGNYSSALPRSASIMFHGGFNTASEFLHLGGVRRAMVAYWNEALMVLKERGVASVYSRFHNWNAVAELHKKIIESE